MKVGVLPRLLNARQFQPHLNYRHIKETASQIEANLRHRAIDSQTANVSNMVALYDQHVSVEFEVGNIRKERNRVAEQMAEVVNALKTAKKDQTVDIKALVSSRNHLAEAGRQIKSKLHELESRLSDISMRLYEEAKHLPNSTAPGVPVGDESKAEVVEVVRSPSSSLLPPNSGDTTANSPKMTEWKGRDHIELCQMHNLADFDRAGKVAGTGFFYMKGLGTLLETALTSYALDICVSRGFMPVSVPDVIRHEVLEACGFAPRSEDPQTYFLDTHMDATLRKAEAGALNDHMRDQPVYDPMRLCLSATAEFSLAAMHAGEVLPLSSLPLRMVGIGRAFRAEGIAGATNRGLYRVHQFQKVEMFALANGGDATKSQEILKEFVDIQKNIYEGLELSFRVLNMPTEELGAPAYQKYDIEAWMPGRNSWGEISSASNCTDYQSRRLNIRHFAQSQKPVSHTNVKPGQSGALEFVHTVNGTAAAIPRLILALLETHQNQEGDIHIPKRLRPYLFGGKLECLKARDSPFPSLK